jgi:hypothetical protein
MTQFGFSEEWRAIAEFQIAEIGNIGAVLAWRSRKYREENTAIGIRC